MHSYLSYLSSKCYNCPSKKRSKKLYMSVCQCSIFRRATTGPRLATLTCHLSPIICHLSLVTYHLSPATCNLSLSQQPLTQTLPRIALPLFAVGWNEKLKYANYLKGAYKPWMTDRKIIFTPAITEPKITPSEFIPAFFQ